VDQIFDRLEELFKSWTAPDSGGRRPGRGSSSGDPDLDAAMSELDDFLDKDRSKARAATEARERAWEADRRAREEKERQAREWAQSRERPKSAEPSRPAGPPAVVLEAYRTMGLPMGTPLPEVKASYKKLLFKYHPDRNSGTPADQKRATEISAKINSAYQVIESWTTTGKVSSE
jgi:hypothetical protein